jgi:hypothetical protein
MSLKGRLKRIPAVLHFYLCLRAILRWFYQPFAYAKLTYGHNLEQQPFLHNEEKQEDYLADMIRQRKFDALLPRIDDGARILDIAAGAGELQMFLRKHHKEVEYIGLDYNDQRVAVARTAGIDVRSFDCSDLDALDSFIEENGPFDVITCIYALYFFPEPERFLATIRGRANRLFLGVFNGGHIQYRVRLLFGRSVCPGFHYYPVGEKQINFSEMTRFWTLKDYVFVLKELGYRSVKLISAKTEGSSIHHSPRRFLFPSLFAMAFFLEVE